MKIYLVGGAVRDRLLGLPIKDRDWVVVGATPEQMINDGYQQVGADFPVFLHPKTKEEYALARTERKKGNGYLGFECHASPDVTLEEDLKRRDLTINAMASFENTLVDPYSGQDDLNKRILRHVSGAFAEDPLRILRVARFAARFHHLGFSIADETIKLMSEIVRSGEASHLVAERIWQETARALGEQSPWVYFEVLRECGALKVLFPELDTLFGVPQPELHHPEIDTGIHSLMSLKAASLLSSDIEVRFAALTHDLGKGLTPMSEWPRHHGHEKKGLTPIKALCARLKAPNDVRTLSLLAGEFHTHVHRAFDLKPATLLKVIKSSDAFRNHSRLKQLLLVCEADAKGRTGYEDTEYPQRQYFLDAFDAANTVEVSELIKQGFNGKELGQAIMRSQQDKIQQIKEAHTH
ncbi:multifunctional CCA addition/repair protein [Alkalimarinus alittae]|uniref:Multifunctional CCA protein n=1 Tax=Alkalimarinus alittae TaxID=2961619 RepID=A0ABY6N4Z0_9ALTE|nr:multifunctional CCA addition/repair protein [Alkalimarinus alittae]UZE97039.1 multifunctional CCA addition/repair protein [Alkalimarinus alittae]